MSDQQPVGQFQAQRGKRSSAQVYESSEEKHSTLCGIKCIRQPWCMGFNAIGNEDNVSCQMIAVKQNDTQIGMVLDNNASYYERIRG